jgi:hypothetical protein
MKIVKTADSHAIVTDDDEVVLPGDVAEIQNVYLADPKIIQALMLALAEDVVGILPVTKDFPQDLAVDPLGNGVRRGVAGALAISNVVAAVAHVPRESEEK